MEKGYLLHIGIILSLRKKKKQIWIVFHTYAIFFFH